MRRQGSRAFVLAAVVAIAVAAAGCGASGPSEEERAAQAAQEAEHDRQDAAATDRVRAYWEDAFGTPGYQPTWYVPPERLTVRAGTLNVVTDYYYDGEGKRAAAQLCGILRGHFVFGSGAGDYEVGDVIVLTSDELILSRSFSGGDCTNRDG